MKIPSSAYPGFEKTLLRLAENRFLKFGSSPAGKD